MKAIRKVNDDRKAVLQIPSEPLVLNQPYSNNDCARIRTDHHVLTGMYKYFLGLSNTAETFVNFIMDEKAHLP